MITSQIRHILSVREIRPPLTFGLTERQRDRIGTTVQAVGIFAVCTRERETGTGYHTVRAETGVDIAVAAKEVVGADGAGRLLAGTGKTTSGVYGDSCESYFAVGGREDKRGGEGNGVVGRLRESKSKAGERK